MTLPTTPFEATRFIRDDADMAEFLFDAFASGHAPLIASTLGIAAKRHGWTRLAKETGINRQALHAALSGQGNPTLDTLLKVTKALGLTLTPLPAKTAETTAVRSET